MLLIRNEHPLKALVQQGGQQRSFALCRTTSSPTKNVAKSVKRNRAVSNPNAAVKTWNAQSAATKSATGAKTKNARNKTAGLSVSERGGAAQKPLRFLLCAYTFVRAPSPTTVIHSRTRQDVTTPFVT